MTPSLAYPRPGERIGPYLISRRLGGGGMGVVFEAADETLDRQVAIKVISPHLADDATFRARFVKEARAMAALDSAHVVHVYAHGEQDGRLYLVTQLVPDGDLGASLRAYGAPPPATAVDLIAQVASGLADAHAIGLIHRDIKPANVLLRRRDDGTTAYLGDFGIARHVDLEPTTMTSTVGTPSYMAPELHTGGTAGVASDVYSLGCLLWATLTGQAPYAGTSDFQIISAHLGEPVPQLDGTSELERATNKILRTAMAKLPEDRYATAAAMREDLTAASRLPSGGPVVAEPTRTRRIPPIAWGAAAVAVVAVLIAAFLLTRPDSQAASVDVPPPSRPTTTAPTTAPTTTPTETAPTETAPTTSASDEALAMANFADALSKQGVFTKTQADCVAQHLIDTVGLDKLVKDRFFGPHFTFENPDLAKLPAEKSALTQATLTCLGAG
ncbi:MAG: serine/threonine-protein kinase [Nocardioides sp.]